MLNPKHSLKNSIPLIIVMAFLLLYSCNNPAPTAIVKPPKPLPQRHVMPFCTRFPKLKITGRQPALAPNYKLQWGQNMVLHVYIMDSARPITNKLLRCANGWFGYGNISFVATDEMFESQLRVTFKSGGYASAVGRECNESAYLNKPTIFLEGLDTLQDDMEFTRTVLHEFGHALGLEHELRKASAKIPWDSAAVFKYYKDHYNWGPTMVIQNIFTPITMPKQYDEFDSTSIMIYAVPDTLTIGHAYSIAWSDGLSKSDKKYIGIWYPKKRSH